MNTGSCLCGDITWQIDGDLIMMSNCHCSMCRKAGGSAYGAYIGVEGDSFHWLSGADKVRTYESSPGGHRPFCGRCGSIVPSKMRTGDAVFMPAGNMDGDLDRPLDSHIFAASRAPWYEIADDAQQFDGYPTGTGLEGVARAERKPPTPGAIGGSCLCGAVAYEFDATLERMGCCHCSRCRKSRSAPFSTQLFVAPDQFRWVAGQDSLTSYKVPESERFVVTFCRICASPMPTAFDEPPVVMVPAGSLDQDPGVRPQAHIFVASKASWYEIADDLPQFDGAPPGA